MGVFETFETLGFLFYIVSPNRTSFETIEEVPDYTTQVVHYFLALLIIEQLYMRYKNGKKTRTMRVNDAFGSISQGILSEISRVFLQSWKLAAYIYVYTHWRIVELPWNSLWTWFICFVGVDFLYYWGHRASHEINFLWAAHQVHHSSEDYNLTTALRQSVFQTYFLTVFNLPLALAIPPSAFLVHSTFNLLYQFWIHTEVVKTLGPLEYILNTASHHRVHHGRNRYCIDKNYAGTLIIWDRMFGTFEAEGEEVVYGLTHPIDTFEPFRIQMCHFMHIWRTFWTTKGFNNKLSVIFKGPGWYPGMPWHGSIEDVPDVKAPIPKYDPPLPLWCKLYVLWHFTLLALGYVEMAEGQQNFPPGILYGAVIYEVFSLSTLGILLEGRLYASWLEFLRSVLYVAIDYYFLPYTRITTRTMNFKLLLTILIRVTFLSSGIFWLRHCIKSVTVKLYSSSKKVK